MSFNYSGSDQGAPNSFSKNESVTEYLAIYLHYLLVHRSHFRESKCSSAVETKAWRTGASEISLQLEEDSEELHTIMEMMCGLSPSSV